MGFGKRRRVFADRIINQHQAGDARVAFKMDIGQRVEDAQGPADDDDRPRSKLVQQIADILTAPDLVIAAGRDFRGSLAARVEGDDVIIW